MRHSTDLKRSGACLSLIWGAMQVYERQVVALANFNLESQKSQPWSIPAG